MQARHLFIPHEANGRRPHAFRHHYAALYAVLLVSVQLVLGIGFWAPRVTASQGNEEERALVELVNQERAANGAHALKVSTLLEQAAHARAADMFERGYFAHVSPDGKKPWQVIAASGYFFASSGENLARGFDRAEDAFDAWLASPPHKANLLEPDFSETGLAIVSGQLAGRSTTIFVQLFAKPVPGTAVGKQTITSEQSKLILNLAAKNPLLRIRLPFVLIAAVILLMIFFDGYMLHVLGHFSQRRHRVTYLLAVVAAAGLILFMFSNIGQIL